MAAVGRLPQLAELRLCLLRADAAALRLARLGVRRAAGGPLHAFALMVRALDPRMLELALKLARDDFMLAVIVAVRDGAQRLAINARPGNVKVLPALLHMLHHDTGLAGQPKLLLEPVDGARLLRVGHQLVRGGVDRGRVERAAAAGGGGDRLHFQKRGGEVGGTNP